MTDVTEVQRALERVKCGPKTKMGDWVKMLVTKKRGEYINFFFCSSDKFDSGGNGFAFDIGFGPVGDEVLKIPKINTEVGRLRDSYVYHFPIKVPPNTTISVRGLADVGSPFAYVAVYVGICDENDW